MFRAAPVNPYDELVVKATHEDLLSEAWDTNLQICDKVSEEGESGRRFKGISAQEPTGSKDLSARLLWSTLGALSPRGSSGSTPSPRQTPQDVPLTSLSAPQTTLPQVKTRTLRFIKQWNDQFGSDPSLGVMRELYDSLKARKFEFEGAASDSSAGGAAGSGEDEQARRERIRREEEEELQRVLEISKQDKGGRGEVHAAKGGQGSSSGSGSSSGPVTGVQAGPSGTSYPDPAANLSAAAVSQPYAARNPTPPPPMPSKATASRVRAIYPFTTTEKGELSFNKGDVIKVIDRMYDEWYTGAVDGRIGIFPVSYVEPMPDPTPAELAKDAREEARVFAAQGMIVALQRMLDRLDPTRGDRLDDPELEELYQKTVALQPEIVGLMKKYSDQKAELEHIHLGFIKAQRQYAQMTQPQVQQPGYPGMGYAAQYPQEYAQERPAHDHRASSYGSMAAAPAVSAQPYPQSQQQLQGYPSLHPQSQPGQPEAQPDQAAIAAAWAQYYQQQQLAATASASASVPAAAPLGSASPGTGHVAANAAVPGQQSQEERDNVAAAWQAYYAAQAQYAQQMAASGYSQQQIQQMQYAQSQAHQPQGHRASGDNYPVNGSAPVASDAGSVRSLSVTAAPPSQGHEPGNSPYAQTTYGHQSRASLSMPQPQIQSYPSQQHGAPTNHSQTSLESAAPAPPAKDQYLPTHHASIPPSGIHMTTSPQPIQSSPYPSVTTAQSEDPFAPQLQHSQSSGNYSSQPASQHAYHTSGAPGQDRVHQPPQLPNEGNHPGAGAGNYQSQPQTGLEAGVANLAFQ
ncbi:hypothetical protein QFC19_008979 [Naganishia cerealis]|uniref:Uncharacterized protein n=1 Tax=Naganishia cerealis TaxID=610337 RepID=A0ACC2UX94_9TREE|nr:hypothetical protein QFC19_008979 [Naganishia cerealis]